MRNQICKWQQIWGIPVLIIIFFGGAFFCSYCNLNENVKNVSKEITTTSNSLKTAIINIDTAKIDSTRNKIELFKLNELQEAKMAFESEKFALELERQKQKLFWYFVSFLGVGTVAGFIAFTFLMPRMIRDKAQVEVDKQIRSIIRGESVTFKNIISKYKDTAALKESKKIFFYDNKYDEELKRFIIETLLFSEKNIVSEIDKADLIFIDNTVNNLERLRNINNSLPDLKKEIGASTTWKALIEFIERKVKGKNKCIFYYDTNGVRFPDKIYQDLEERAKINFANGPAQIEANLINTLRYQDKL